VPLTWCLPDHSLAVGSLLKAGCSPWLTLKLFFASTTILSRLDRACLAALTLKKPLQLFKSTLPMHYLMAVPLPVFLSPRWIGTDIGLWAIVPWVLLAVRQTATADSRDVVWAGLAARFPVSPSKIMYRLAR
jgi:hypothetical protein